MRDRLPIRLLKPALNLGEEVKTFHRVFDRGVRW